MAAIARNDPCPCGSGKKYKKCCMGKSATSAEAVPSQTETVMTALSLQQAGRLQEAAALYDQVLRAEPDNIDALHLLGLIAHQAGQHQMALDLIGRAIQVSPATALFHCNIGPVYLTMNRPQDALASYRKAIELQPDYVEAYNNLGQLYEAIGQDKAAEQSYRQALLLRPDYAEAHYNLGNVLRKTGDLPGALACYQAALAHKPYFPDAHNNVGIVLMEMGRAEEAIACYRHAIEQSAEYVAAYNNLGAALRSLGRLDEAMAEFHRVLEIKPDYAEVHCNIGNVHKDLGQMAEAIAAYQQAAACKTDYVEAHYNLGCAYAEVGQREAALSSYQRAIEINPGYAIAHNNLAVILREAGRFEESIAASRKALEFMPELAEAYNNIGNALGGQGRLEEAIDSYRKAVEIRPHYADAFSNLLLTLQYSDKISAKELFAEHLRYAEQFEAPLRVHWQAHANARDPGKRLKIGYVSADFRNHAVAYFIEPILKRHGHGQFEIFCYHNTQLDDAVTARLKTCADHWIPCKHLSDEQLAEQVRQDGIDILIDLSGHTAHNRLLMFARKPAPVQATWIGYAGTTGLSAMDYRITSASLDPEGEADACHSEKLLRLSESFIFQPESFAPEVNQLPALSGKPLTFACLNNPAKITPAAIALWARILRMLPGARLMLGNVYSYAMRNELIRRFARAGIAEDRLLLQDRCSLLEYLELHRQIDIGLDSFPYNGGTTTLHALWMGVPVVTLTGGKAVSRAGASTMKYTGLSEFVASSQDEYVEIAVRAANDLPNLDRIRQSLRERILSNPASNPVHFVREVETAYRDIWQKWCGGQA